MKKIIISIVFVLTLINTVSADVWVDGYFRSDGTYVQGHYRSSPDSSVTNNWSYSGNVNPYTGEIGSNSYGSDSLFGTTDSLNLFGTTGTLGTSGTLGTFETLGTFGTSGTLGTSGTFGSSLLLD